MLAAFGSAVGGRAAALRTPGRPLTLGVPLGLALLLALYLVVLWPWMTHGGTTAEERARTLPGDELVPVATDQSTRAVTVRAPADETWRWLVQIGEDRAGFYSYAWLENLFGADIHNADRVHPEWQTLRAGDLVRAVPDDYLGGALLQPGWRVAAVEPGRWFVLRGWGGFLVEPVDAGTSRVLVRTRFRDDTWWGPVITRLAFGPVHFVMERRWPVLLAIPVVVLLVLLLAPDAFLAFGLLFLGAVFAWAVAGAARTRRRIGGAARGATATLLLVAAAPLIASSASAQASEHAPDRALAVALARYEALAAAPDLRPPAPGGIVRRGDALPAASALRRYLVALSDISPAAREAVPVEADTLYDDALADGVIAFQRRHGLEPDGVIGPATTAAMRVPLGQRARQLALALERWRQLPDSAPERFIVVNVPAFRLYAFERADATAWPRLRMNVVVGEADGGRATPRFSGTLREVVFRPYWDVPASIARAELLPRIRRDPAYVEREHLEIVRGGDHDAVRHPPTAANLARVASGALRLRQRPGPWNALGAVKLLFPNRFNVYLHGTPAPELFARSRRDFSHGCVRVEDPAALAAWVLGDEAGWDRDAVVAAMTRGPESRRVQVARPVTVHVLYATAAVGEDGVVRFYPDIYGHDGVPGRTAGATGDEVTLRVGRPGASDVRSEVLPSCVDGPADGPES